ncbi:MAG: hypothetical protein IIZ39_12190, partial [Blautia sp.]|nr:hypothetical protein [Blautia sp.]
EGYWSDHWDYNMDLIEDYLAVFPEKERELLSDDSYTWFAPAVKVNDRAKRYEKTEGGIRQYYSISPDRLEPQGKEVTDQKGEVIKASLAEKLLVLTAIKSATLDPFGMGVEMEGGKPGWYDALNGLPGMLGSSMPESCELLRMALYLRDSVRKYNMSIRVFDEAASFIETLSDILKKNEKDTGFAYWNESNDAKEAYRSRVYSGLSGEKRELSYEVVDDFLTEVIKRLSNGMETAKSYSKEDVFPTYFYFDVTDYEEDAEGIRPLSFKVGQMPLFLEGPVRYLKLPLEQADRGSLYRSVKGSRLYDDKLSMYKVNAALEEASFEIGRCRSFTPGWLENESIWLHMEYKYLLELLKSGMYREFFEDFKKACVAFLDPDTYGRNPLENSSFIASSANPDEKKWGRGFVARLSGSTAEFLSMWRRMFFGENPFVMDGDELVFAPLPAIPAYLIPEDGSLEAMLLGSIPATFKIPSQNDIIPGEYTIREIVLHYGDKKGNIVGDRVKGEAAWAIRKGEVTGIEILL